MRDKDKRQNHTHDIVLNNTLKAEAFGSDVMTMFLQPFHVITRIQPDIRKSVIQNIESQAQSYHI